MKICLVLTTFVFAGPLRAQSITLYQESFSGGNPDLIWLAADGVSQVQTASRSNPSGDNSVGYVAGVPDFGNTGQILAGAQTLKDYKIEAQVYLTRAASAGSGTNNGILARIIPLPQGFKGYVLASDFDSNNRLRLRKFLDAPAGTPPAVLRDWNALEIPGGLPAASGWHKLGLEFQGSQINVYYDDQLLPGSPFTDTEADSGYFGVYCFVGFETASDSASYFDDVLVSGTSTAVDDQPVATPSTFALLQNYPNPFNPSTTIVFSLENAALIQLDIHNLIGQKIVTLASGLWPAGEHRLSWEATGLPSGIYIARLQVGGPTQTKRLILAR
ncbi:MAG: T9SS type A sorting domain-containing protein [bacterium]